MFCCQYQPTFITKQDECALDPILGCRRSGSLQIAAYAAGSDETLKPETLNPEMLSFDEKIEDLRLSVQGSGDKLYPKRSTLNFTWLQDFRRMPSLEADIPQGLPIGLSGSYKASQKGELP